jgi:hypothetical protein
MTSAKMPVTCPTMKVVNMDYDILRNYVNGCIKAVKDERLVDTWISGQKRGIEDALKIVDEKDLTYIMRMTLKGMECIDENYSFYKLKDQSNYFAAYKISLSTAVKILTGENIESTL